MSWANSFLLLVIEVQTLFLNNKVCHVFKEYVSYGSCCWEGDGKILKDSVAMRSGCWDKLPGYQEADTLFEVVKINWNKLCWHVLQRVADPISSPFTLGSLWHFLPGLAFVAKVNKRQPGCPQMFTSAALDVCLLTIYYDLRVLFIPDANDGERIDSPPKCFN